jgi:release factor glutamine methyltransferase
VKNLRIFASDISRKALNIARLNAQLHKIPQMSLRWRPARTPEGDVSPEAERRQQQSPSISFCYGNLFEPLKGIKADMIVSNPPYVDRAEKSRWQAGLRYEPSRALWAGKKGLAYIEKIIKQAPDYLKPGGWLLLEIGQGQAKATLRVIKATRAFRDIRILKDYSNIPRVLAAVKG